MPTPTLDELDQHVSVLEKEVGVIKAQGTGLSNKMDLLFDEQLSIKQSVTFLHRRIDILTNGVNAQFESIDSRFAEVEKRLRRMESRMSSLEDRLEKVEKGLKIVEDKIDGITPIILESIRELFAELKK